MSNSLFDLQDKVAVVTGAGANGGLGHTLAIGLAGQGADIAVLDQDEQGAHISAQQIHALGRKSLAVRCDVSKPDEVEHSFVQVDRIFGKIDILINNAYSFPSRVHPDELTLEAWEKTIAVSLTGYFLCAQQAIRRMLSGSSHNLCENISPNLCENRVGTEFR